jgi:hypothetical protein
VDYSLLPPYFQEAIAIKGEAGRHFCRTGLPTHVDRGHARLSFTGYSAASLLGLLASFFILNSRLRFLHLSISASLLSSTRQLDFGSSTAAIITDEENALRSLQEHL